MKYSFGSDCRNQNLKLQKKNLLLYILGLAATPLASRSHVFEESDRVNDIA